MPSKQPTDVTQKSEFDDCILREKSEDDEQESVSSSSVTHQPEVKHEEPPRKSIIEDLKTKNRKQLKVNIPKNNRQLEYQMDVRLFYFYNSNQLIL